MRTRPRRIEKRSRFMTTPPWSSWSSERSLRLVLRLDVAGDRDAARDVAEQVCGPRVRGLRLGVGDDHLRLAGTSASRRARSAAKPRRGGRRSRRARRREPRRRERVSTAVAVSAVAGSAAVVSTRAVSAGWRGDDDSGVVLLDLDLDRLRVQAGGDERERDDERERRAGSDGQACSDGRGRPARRAPPQQEQCQHGGPAIFNGNHGRPWRSADLVPWHLTGP